MKRAYQEDIKLESLGLGTGVVKFILAYGLPVHLAPGVLQHILHVRHPCSALFGPADASISANQPEGQLLCALLCQGMAEYLWQTVSIHNAVQLNFFSLWPNVTGAWQSLLTRLIQVSRCQWSRLVGRGNEDVRDSEELQFCLKSSLQWGQTGRAHQVGPGLDFALPVAQGCQGRDDDVRACDAQELLLERQCGNGLRSLAQALRKRQQCTQYTTGFCAGLEVRVRWVGLVSKGAAWAHGMQPFRGGVQKF